MTSPLGSARVAVRLTPQSGFRSPATDTQGTQKKLYQACLRELGLRDSPSKTCLGVLPQSYVSGDPTVLVWVDSQSCVLYWSDPSELCLGITPKLYIAVASQRYIRGTPIVVYWGDPSELGFRGRGTF